MTGSGQHPFAYQKDPRGQLYSAYIRWVAALQPVAVVMENVPDILSYGGENVAEIIAETLDSMGYEARYTLLNAAFYGVPQTRERWYLIAIHRAAGVVPHFPNPTHFTTLPRGYLGTRSHAMAWKTLAEGARPAHALLVPEAEGQLQPATSCRDALSDLPTVRPEMKEQKGRRDLNVRLPYRSAPSTPYQHQMREWGGHPSAADVSAQVIRHLPRDWETFRRMPQGAYYPQAWEVAWARFQEKLTALRTGGEQIPEGGPRWTEVRDSIVPPYDREKFPNKWWKLQEGLPSRTLMAHLSHDSYSHIHYDAFEARTISVREAARLQSFPDHFEFCGAMNAAFGQIGNAVPPLMAWQLAKAVCETLANASTHIDVSAPVSGKRSRAGSAQQEIPYQPSQAQARQGA